MMLTKEKYAIAGCYNLFFVDGVLDESLSDVLPQKVKLKTQATGFHLEVAAGYRVDKPLHLLFVLSEHEQLLTLAKHHQLSIEQDAYVDIIEQYLAVNKTVANCDVTITWHVDKAACLRHTKVILENDYSQHTAQHHVTQHAKSQFYSACFSLKGKLTCNKLELKLMGERAESYLAGLYCATQKDQVEQHISVEHLHANTVSRACFKGILQQQGRGIFDGRIYVANQAQGTDAILSNKNVLLSDEAVINTNPHLEIYADDVKCAHGTTVGHLDEAAFFYMQSRGLPLAQAQRLLLLAFAQDVLSSLSFKPLKEKLVAELEASYV